MLKRVLKLKGYSITGGQLEVFPSNNGLRLPLQAGFAWIDQNESIIASRDEISFEDAISRFVADIETTENDWEYTKSRIGQALSEHASQLGSQLYEERLSTEGMDALYSCKLIEENYNLGKHYWLNGLSSAGERHQAIICIEHMLWHGSDELSIPAYPGSFNDQERFRILCQWLKRSHNGYCRHILEGKWETVEAQIQRACSWRADKTAERTPYTLISDSAIDRIAHLSRKTGRTWTLEDWRKANQRRQDAAIKRIEKALKELHLSGQLITISSVSRQSGTDRKTVRKYKYLLAAWGSDQNLGGGLLPALPQEDLEDPDKVLDLSEKKELPIHAGLVSRAFSSDLQDGCLTPCAEDLVRRRGTTESMDLQLVSPPSLRRIKAQGSSTGLEGLRYAFGDFFLFRLRSGQLRHGGKLSEEDRRGLDRASGPQEKDRAWDLIGTAFKGSRSNVSSLRGGIIGGGSETALPAASGGLGSEIPSGDRSRDAEQEIISCDLNPGAALVSLGHQEEEISFCGELEQTEAASARRKSPKQSALDSPVPDSRIG
ncbi:MAG: hypothetical protein AB7V06_27230 [Candidatus Obscuribacterales bacterium]